MYSDNWAPCNNEDDINIAYILLLNITVTVQFVCNCGS